MENKEVEGEQKERNKDQMVKTHLTRKTQGQVGCATFRKAYLGLSWFKERNQQKHIA